ncbi:DUF2812 domain-containing protein [Paenibacillus sp. XY044]|uniref:DUF2812 domain-containing protein n=1 Tax=Paenibacillus sp. XY044 TaxID=2026089 RepID=UPI000B984D12|nr:DUF2812 domain-containing protein [Paenibacillus sp. XY044]OZB90883.1 hypothetical protein CJP46_31210 [Paenibacillus sp. XY044]
MKETKSVWFPAYRHVVPAELERWLEQMSGRGWHVDRIRQWSSLHMTFRRGEPKQYRYVYDLQAAPKRDYKATYEQFGWELVGKMASVYIWRKAYDVDRPESFTDTESLQQRGRRVIRAISFSFYLFLMAAVVLTLCLVLFFGGLTAEQKIQYAVGMLLAYGFTVYLGMVMRSVSRAKGD